MRHLVFLFLLFTALAIGQSQDLTAVPVRTVTFNVLAPLWADPSLYPPGSHLDREFRRARIVATLNSLKGDADIIALQEVVESEFPYFLAGLGKDWVGYPAYHAPDYWSNWLIPELPWEPNGVAIFVNIKAFKSIQFADVALSDSGNHGVIFQGIQKGTNTPIRAASIHLDSDHAYNRNRELGALLTLLPRNNSIIDVIAGDLNTDSDTTNVQADLKKAGFLEILKELGTATKTSPYAASYYSSGNWAIIDHILIRNLVPLEGHVVNFGLYDTYPILPSGNDDERIKANFDISGSDHFPVVGSGE